MEPGCLHCFAMFSLLFASVAPASCAIGLADDGCHHDLCVLLQRPATKAPEAGARRARLPASRYAGVRPGSS